jgi:ParB family chromosome partitioning protein
MSAAEKKGRRALGRGLDALLPSKPKERDERYGRRAVFICPIERIQPCRDQPRKHMDSAALAELAATIAEHGIIQPLVVRRLGEPGPDERFELIAGERRWRASQQAGLKEVPVVVKDVSPQKAFELALIENLQRQDLNPIEIAEAYQRLLDDLGHTQEQLAQRVGKSRVAVTNAIRLLKLPDAVRTMLNDGTLSEGHGRALLGAPDAETMIDVARKAARGRFSVRKVEQLVRLKREPSADAPKPDKSAGVRDLEARLSRVLGTRVSVEHRGPGGKVQVSYSDLDELDRIIATVGA